MKKEFMFFSLAFLLLTILVIVSAIPNPAPVYCTEMGYIENSTHCIFNDNNSCELWSFYNGKCGQNYVKDLSCTQFGNSLLPGHKCCEGLTSTNPVSATNIDENGLCAYSVGGWSLCLKCGDGICDKETENSCNCPKDCPATNTTPACIQQGKAGSIIKDIPDKCCSGLVQLARAFLASNGLCIAPTDGSFVCSNCGNGICGLGENVCNCPEDCKTTVECKLGQKIGDVDGDNDIDVIDLNLTAKLVVGLIPLPNNICCADVTRDGKITATDWTKLGRIVAGLEQSPGVCGGTCTDSDGGINYYVKGIIKGGLVCDYNDENCGEFGSYNEDLCLPMTAPFGEQTSIQEWYCDNNKVKSQVFECPSKKCENGACIQGALVSEQVKCVFTGSDKPQRCYSGPGSRCIGNVCTLGQPYWSCTTSGCEGENCVQTCIVNVSGYIGEQLTWKSTCGGYAYTSITGENKYAKFDCLTSGCNSQQCEDGSWTKCYQENGYCTCSTCPGIIVKPVCGNGLCESGEGLICSTTAVACEAGKECKTSEGKCYYGCEKDCKNIQGIYAKLDEKFKLQVNQLVKITDYKNMKITFRDLLTLKCEAATTTSSEVKEKSAIYASPPSESNSSGASGSTSIIKCPNVGPMAQLEVEIPEIEGRKILTLKLGESKIIYDIAVVFVDYDYASRTGVFVVKSVASTCPENCKCDENGNIIACHSIPLCKENQILCPDGVCRETCAITNITLCDYGCIYNNKCLTIGTRAKGLFCSLDGTMSNQLSSSEKCENNFECSTNICVDGKCLSSNFIQKIISWFKKLFGG